AARALSKSGEILLKQAFFALADCRFYLREYDEAIRLYDGLASRYQHEYESLVALRQLWRCYVIPADKTYWSKADATLQRARAVLNEMGDAVFQGRAGTDSREGWERWINESAEQLKKIGL